MPVALIVGSNSKTTTIDLDKYGLLTNGDTVLGSYPGYADFAVINNTQAVNGSNVIQHDIAIDLSTYSSLLISRCKLIDGQVVIKIWMPGMFEEYYTLVNNKITQVNVNSLDIIDEIQFQVYQLDNTIFNDPIVIRWIDFLWGTWSWTNSQHGIELLLTSSTNLRVIPITSESISPVEKPTSLNFTDVQEKDAELREIDIKISEIQEAIDDLTSTTRNLFVSR